MNVLHLTHYQTPGRRFTGLDIAPLLEKDGITSTHVVWQPDAPDPNVHVYDSPFTHQITAMYQRIEEKHSIQSLLPQNFLELQNSAAFRKADVVHCHLIHTGYGSLYELPEISALKPTVWTIHDPWAITGHCIYPGDCTRWLTGCGHCPDLRQPLNMHNDHTALMHRFKSYIYKRSRLQVIAASNWMLDMIRRSPLLRDFPSHHIPFGVDLDTFSPEHAKQARSRFEISVDEVVLLFRNQPHGYKGVDYLLAALRQLPRRHKICLLTVDGLPGALADFSDRFRVIELGWSNDQILMRDAISAADVFIMPSIAEAFGLMAVEAMACGKPVICFDGTALPEVTSAPHIGIAVPIRDSDALAKAILHLVEHPEERQKRGNLGREYATLRYDRQQHVSRIGSLYRNVAASSG